MTPSLQQGCRRGTRPAAAQATGPGPATATAPAPRAALALLLSLALCFGLGLPAGSAQASLITNGSFESPSVPVGGFIGIPADSAALDGWAIVGIDVAVINGSFTQSGISFQAQDGNQFLDLSGVSSNSRSNGVIQTMDTTPGAAYTISFYVGSATDNEVFFPSTIELSIDGKTPVSYSNPAAPSSLQDWKLFNVDFIAAGSRTSLAFYNGGDDNNFTAALDNVSVVAAVPEPGSIGLVLAALCATAVATRARRA